MNQKRAANKALKRYRKAIKKLNKSTIPEFYKPYGIEILRALLWTDIKIIYGGDMPDDEIVYPDEESLVVENIVIH